MPHPVSVLGAEAAELVPVRPPRFLSRALLSTKKGSVLRRTPETIHRGPWVSLPPLHRSIHSARAHVSRWQSYPFPSPFRAQDEGECERARCHRVVPRGQPPFVFSTEPAPRLPSSLS